jgi:hypothetical protein
LLQPENELVPIVVKEAGKVNDPLMPLQSRNALALMVVSLLGKDTEVK